MSAPSVFLFGRHCSTTAETLRELVRAGIPVAAIVVPSRKRGVQIVQSPEIANRIPLLPIGDTPTVLPNVATLGWSAGAALIESSRKELDTLADRFPAMSRSIVVASCFPWMIPATILERSRFTPLNVHPSLLPRHRGPEPLFWTFHEGDATAGATIHQLTGEYDSGPIVSSTSISVPVDSRYQDLQRSLDQIGANLLADFLKGLPESPGSAQDQSGESVTFAPLPTPEHLVVTPAWSAERAFRFVRGVTDEFGPIRVVFQEGRQIEVRDAVALRHGKHLGRQFAPHGSLVSVQFSSGVVDFERC